MQDAADAGLFVGRTRLSLGDPIGAVEVFRQITPTYQALVEADPLNRSARFELADAFKYSGQALATIAADSSRQSSATVGLKRGRVISAA